MKSKFFLTLLFIIFLNFFSYSQTLNLLSPPNNAKCAPPNIHLAWDAALGFNYYKVVVATDFNLNNVVYTKDSITLLYEDVYNLNYATKYYWQVTAWKINDTTTLQSEIWNFTTNYQPATTIFPIDSSYCVTKIAQFVWKKEEGAQKYVLQISRATTFTGPTVTYDTIVNDTSKLVNNLLPNTRYWWRVRAIYQDCEAYWSESKTFRTVPAPMVLLYPADGSYGTSLFPQAGQFNISFLWNAVNNAGFYHIQITDNLQNDSLIYETATSDTLINITSNEVPFEYNKTYYWRVRAHIVSDSVHCFTEFSDWFSLKSPYKAPTLVLPENGVTCVDIEQPLYWNAVEGANAYEIIVSSKADFSDTLHKAYNVTDTIVGFPFNRELSQYYWKVRAFDNNNKGYWSTPFSFTTTLLPPGYENPIDSAGGYSLTVYYVWRNKGDNAKYSIQISDKSDFSNLLVDATDLTERTFTYTHAEYFKYYYWRVKVHLNGCSSAWSKTYVFRTQLPAPILQLPENNATNVEHTPTFSWKPVSGARSYEFMLDTKSNFSTAIIRSNIPTNEVRLVQTLNENTIYYWRVRAINEEGTSPWSSVFTFTTGYYLPDVPRIIAPANESTKHPINGLQLVWTSANRAQKYQLQVTKLPEFTQLIVDNDNLIDTTYVLNNLENYTVYLFRVRAINQGGASDWSLPYSFRTINVAPTTPPDLTVPANGAINQPLGIRLTWLPVQRAEGYRLQVAKDESFNNLFVNELEIYLTYYNLFNLAENTEYYWRVKAWNEAGDGPWSEVRKFKTLQTTSVQDNDVNKYNLKVFPNPVKSDFQISFYSPIQSIANVALYNLYGQKIHQCMNYQITPGTNNITLNVNDVPNGVYIWHITFDNEQIHGYITISK